MPETPEPSPFPAAPAVPAAEEPAVGLALYDAFRVVLDRPLLFLGRWICTAAPAELLNYGFKQWAGHGTKKGLEHAFAANPSLLVAYAMIIFIGLAAHLLSQAAAATASADALGGREPAFRDSLERAFERLPALIWTAVVVMLRIIGGLLLLIIPGILMAIRYGLANYVTIFEGLSGGAAAARSRELVLPRLGRLVLLFLAVAGTVMIAVVAALVLDAFVAAAMALVGLKAAVPLVIGLVAAAMALAKAWSVAAIAGYYLKIAALPAPVPAAPKA